MTITVQSRPSRSTAKSPVVARLAAASALLPGVGQVAYVDADDTVREVHGYAKQGVGFGCSGVKGLNALIATVSTPSAAPLIAATRLRRGSVNSARGAARLIADALVTPGPSLPAARAAAG